MSEHENDLAKHLNAFQDLENQVCKLKAMTEILVLISGEKESRDKAEQMFVAIENLDLLMQGFSADFKHALEASLSGKSNEAPAPID
jgi:hypothetical protein